MGEGLEEERMNCKELIYDYNLTRPSQTIERKEILKKLLGTTGDNFL